MSPSQPARAARAEMVFPKLFLSTESSRVVLARYVPFYLNKINFVVRV